MRLMPPSIVWGGLEKLMLEWFEHIDFNRCRVTLVVSTGGGAIYREHIKASHLPVEVIEFPFRVDFRYIDSFPERFAKTLKLLSAIKPTEVVFSQGSFFCFDLSHVLAANIAAGGNVYMHENLGCPAPSPKSSKKYLGFIPGIGLWWYAERYLTPMRARFCKKIFTVSREIRDRVIELWHYPPQKVEVLYHGADVTKYRPSAEIRQRMRQQLGISETDIVIILPARLSQEKCVDRAINAFNLLYQQHPNVRLLIAGTGPDEGKLKSLAAAKTSKDRITFLGFVTNLQEYYQMSDIYVLSSDNEGLSLAFMEAMASGLIAVSTRCTGSTEVIQNTINGFLVDKSVEGVYDGLRQAVTLDTVTRREISRKAVHFVKEHLELNRNIKRALKLLNIPQKIL